MNILLAAVCLFTNLQEPEKQICWESIGLYNDREFKEELPENDWLMKQYQEKSHKYVNRVKENAKKILAEKGFELVECPIHRPECLGHTKDCKKEHQPDTDILKKIDNPDAPYHMRLKLTYSMPFNRVKIFVRVEVYKQDKLLFSFDDETSCSWRAAFNYERRRENIVKFGNKVAGTMADKIKEHQKNSVK